MNRSGFYILCISCLTSSLLWSKNDPVIIANQSVDEFDIEQSTIQRFYLGKKTVWRNGDKVVPVILKKNGVYESFLAKIIKKTTAQYSAFWKQAIFTGKGTPPKSFSREKDLIDYVAHTKGAIGYISGTTNANGIKIIKVQY